MPFFDGTGGPVYFKWWRSETPAAAIVFLHGFGEHSGMYHRLGNALNYENIDLWALDEIGHGLTYGERGDIDSLESLVENGSRLLALAVGAALERPVFLMGHSLGSSVAVTLAVTRKPRIAGLILSATSFGPDTVAWLSQTDKGGNEPEPDAMEPLQMSSDPFYLDELENDPLINLQAPAAAAASAAAVMPRAAGAFEAHGLRADLPVLMVHGTSDPVIPVSDARAVAAKIANAELVEFDALHDVLNDAEHRAVASTIASFVRKSASA